MIAAYVVSPIDLVPDFIPVLGQVDDAILVPLGIFVATRLMPPEVLDEHRRRAAILAEAPTDWRVGAVVLAFGPSSGGDAPLRRKGCTCSFLGCGPRCLPCSGEDSPTTAQDSLVNNHRNLCDS